MKETSVAAELGFVKDTRPVKNKAEYGMSHKIRELLSEMGSTKKPVTKSKKFSTLEEARLFQAQVSGAAADLGYYSTRSVLSRGDQSVFVQSYETTIVQDELGVKLVITVYPADYVLP